MRRMLDLKEKEINLKQIKVLTEKAKELKDILAYNLSLINLQKVQREHEDKFRPYLRTKKDKEDKMVIKQIESDLKNTEDSIALLEAQIKTGVEIREKKEETKYLG